MPSFNVVPTPGYPLVKQVGEYVLLLAVYDKSERANLAPGELDALLVAAGL